MKFARITAALVAVMLIIIIMASATIAGSVYGRDTAALGARTGTGTWTNLINYAAIKLQRIWIEADLNATNTVTITRVTSDIAYTQTCASVTCTSGVGNSATLTAAHLKYGDMLAFSSAVATGATAMIEYEVQKH